MECKWNMFEKIFGIYENYSKARYLSLKTFTVSFRPESENIVVHSRLVWVYNEKLQISLPDFDKIVNLIIDMHGSDCD